MQYLLKNTEISEIVEEKYVDRKYQLDFLKEYFKQNKKEFYVQMPPGTGKTYCGLLLIKDDLKDNKKNKYIIFVPTKDLAYQTYNLYKKIKIKTALIGDGKHKIKKNSNVIVCIYNSVEHIPTDMTFKYKILDEAHHLEILNKKNKTYRNNIIEDIKSEKTIGFSATYHNQENLDFVYEEAKAIEDGYITDYTIDVHYFTKGDKTKAFVKLIKKNVGLWSPMFVYFNTNKKCEDFNNLLLDEEINSVCILGDTPAKTRNRYKKK